MLRLVAPPLVRLLAKLRPSKPALPLKSPLAIRGFFVFSELDIGMTIGLFWHPDVFLHDLHAGHAAMDAHRIQQVAEAVLAVSGTVPVLAEPVDQTSLSAVHDPDYLDYLASGETLPAGESVVLAPDTAMNCHTWRALALSAGAARQAVDAVLSGRFSHTFNPVYAGHHADYQGPDGFCFVNMALVAVQRARELGLTRIAVLDCDVHSGNGTVMGLLNSTDVMFAETYQPGYPGAFLQKLQRPEHILRKKCTRRQDFRRAWEKFFPVLRTYAPQLVIVSAGFDAHRADPLGTLGLVDDDYAWFAGELLGLAAPVVATLEGGYSVPDVARCAALFVKTLASGQ